MSRPALSALRALEIIDLMAGQPSQAFTLSEIVRLTGTNAASVHAILSVLQQRGYLLKHPAHKTYRLAPSIVAIGEAAALHDPLLASAREAAAELASRSGLETLLTARAGADIIGVARIASSRHLPVNLRVGQRVPLRAPFGGMFVAYADPAEVDEWVAPEGNETPPEIQELHRAALALQRERGYVVSLRTPQHQEWTRMLTGQDPAGISQERLAETLSALDNGLYQPQTIELGASYAVQMMSVPIFDRQGQVLFQLAVNFGTDPITGADIEAHAELMLGLANAAMGANHIAAPRKAQRQGRG